MVKYYNLLGGLYYELWISKKNLNGVCTIEDAKVFSSLTEADYTQKCLMSRYAIHQSNIYISTIEPSK